MEVSRHLLLLFLVALATTAVLSLDPADETTDSPASIDTSSTITSEETPDTSSTNDPVTPGTSPTNDFSPGSQTETGTVTVTDTSSTDGNSAETSVTPSSISPNTPGPDENASVSPSSNVSDSPPPSTSPDPSNLCEGDPCGEIATCVKLNNTHFCLCTDGFYYSSSNKTCSEGKTFPGEITVKVNDTSGLDDENSFNYQQLHETITEFFENALNDTDYQQTVIVSVSIVTRTGRSLKSTTPVQVSILNIFSEDTEETESSVFKRINDAAASDSMFSEYKSQNCPPECIAKNKQQCIVDDGTFQCVCLPGYQNKTGSNNDLLCEACPFGYSGKDCKDQFQLILTIVGTVAGVLILSLVIALIISANSKNKNKKLEEQQLIDNDFQNLRLQQTGFSNAGAEGNMFPKVRTSASRDGPSQNPYISQRNIPRPDY